MESCYAGVDIFLGSIYTYTNSSSGCKIKVAMERGGTVMSGSDTDIFICKDLGDVMWVDAWNNKRNNS